MGCIFARPVPVSGAPRADRPHQRIQSSQRVVVSNDPCLTDFQRITAELRSIAKIAGTNPLVCLSDSSFPLVVSRLFLEDDKPTAVSLPVVAGARFGQGKLIVFGNASILLEENRGTGDTEMFLMSACQWAADNESESTSFLLFDFPEQYLEETKLFISEFNMTVEVNDSLENVQQYRAVVATSTSRLDDRIIEYVRNGGSLICLYNPVGDSSGCFFDVNSVLVPMGIGFTCCCFSTGDSKSFRVEVPRRYQEVSHLTFKGACERYIEALKRDNLKENELDGMVTALKFYLMVWSDAQSEELVPLADATWEFLNRTGYKSEKGICPEMEHVIALILAGQLLYKLPKTYVAGLARRLGSNEFPGANGEVELGVHKVVLNIESFAWFSTGLWLPANSIGKVKCRVPMPYLHIQIGAHHESLLSKPGPYKRWPVAVMSYPIMESVIEIVSPFGGMVYLVGGQLPEDAPPQVELEISGVCKYPCMVMGNPEVWKRTKDIDVPWCELSAPTFILTVPTAVVREHESDMENFFRIFDTLISETVKFTSCVLCRPYRVVFDVEVVNDGMSFGYPLVLPIDDLPHILSSDQPTAQLFELLTVITNISIRENCFDAATEVALVTVSACSAMKCVWPDCNPLIFLEGDASPLFNDLWDLHMKYDSTLIPRTLAIFQSSSYKVLSTPDDMWIEFIYQLCRIGKRNFTPLLQHARPIPLNISLSLQSLPEFHQIGVNE